MTIIVTKFLDSDAIDFGVKQTDNKLHTIAELADSAGNTSKIRLNSNESEYELAVNLRGHICQENSTSELLDGDETFSGVWQDTIDYGTIIIGVSIDQDSALDGLEILWSADGITEHDSDQYSLFANKNKNFAFKPVRRYVKLRYTNGATPQGLFNLEVRLSRVYIVPSTHRINDSIVGEDDAQLIKAVLTGENPQGTFVNFQSTTSGNFKVSLEEFESEVSTNNNTQLNTTLFASSGSEFKQDPSTGAFSTIDYAHAEIHSGDHFYHKDWTDLGNGAIYDILVVTPNTTKWAHFEFLLAAEAEFNLILYAGVTTSNNGTSLMAVNRNGNSLTANTLLLFHTPTITDLGTQISRYKGGSGKQIGGIVRANNEQILTQNTKFLARITNDTTTNNWIDWLLDWYEHTNRT